ncbi:MAG: hypothetical protein ACFFB3_23445 [Candidatus Hodarchaeota archaeon]
MSWEYRVVFRAADSQKLMDHLSTKDKMTEQLEQLAKEGWEPSG